MTNTERKAYMKQYYQEHKEEAKAYSQEHKEEKRVSMVLWRQENKGKLREYKQRSRLSLKVAIFTHYGKGKCACVKCGESRLACLSIDHCNGRKAAGDDRTLTGENIYYWLRKQDYPEGYQTLCMNCQWVKRYEEMAMGGRSR